MSDVTVFGLVSGTHVIEDLGMSVPHGHTITIPADKAQKSKDLWRAIGQRNLFLIQSGPYLHRTVNVAAGAIPPAPTHVPMDKSFLDRQRALEEENQQLRDALQRQRLEAQSAEQRQQAKLDTILDMLKTGIPTMGVQAAPGSSPQAPTRAVADDAPTFIPAVIRPEPVESRIEAKHAESDTTLSGASDKLRELRRKPKP